MILKLWDKTEYQVSQAEAEKVGQMIDEGVEWVVFGIERIRTKAIAKIVKGGTGQAILDNQKLLADNRTATSEGMRKAREKLNERLSRKKPPLKQENLKTEREWK